MNKFGIVQGRLSPRMNNQYQSHPAGYWHSEFFIAKELGLDLIQWLVDEETFEENPIMSEKGRSEILKISSRSGVKVQSLCADILIKIPLFGSKEEQAKESLEKIILNAGKMGIRNIIIPCLDNSSLNTLKKKNSFISIVKEYIDLASSNNINLCIESDLNPTELINLLQCLEEENLFINYDIGNSASLGYDSEEEFNAYGSLISHIHIKDRKRGSTSVPLGSGDANFFKTIKRIKKINYQGPLVFESARGANFFEDINLIQTQMNFFRQLWDKN